MNVDRDRLKQKEQELTQRINRLTKELRQVQVELLVAHADTMMRKGAVYVPCGRTG